MPETLRAKALRLFQLKRRLESSNIDGFCACVTCGKVDHYTKMQGGHFIPKGISSYHAFEDKNVHVQCPGCNLYGMKHGIAAYRYHTYMVDRYGKKQVEKMLADAKKPIKFYAADYREMIRAYNAKIKKLKSKML